MILLDRSLGLCLLECVTGQYPYDVTGGPVQLAIQVKVHLIIGQDVLHCWCILVNLKLGVSCFMLLQGICGIASLLSSILEIYSYLIVLSFATQVIQEDCPLPAWGTISAQLMDFLQLCLQKDPRRRPPADQLLKHPFIQKACSCVLNIRQILT